MLLSASRVVAPCGVATRAPRSAAPLARSARPLAPKLTPERAAPRHARGQACIVRSFGLLKDVGAAGTLIQSANDMFLKFDANGDGELSLDELIELLNSEEYAAAFQEAAPGVDIPDRSRSDLEPLFHELDGDKSGALSRHEFLVLWARLVMDRCKAEPSVIAKAVLGFLDQDGDGKIDGKELKRFAPMFGPPGLLMMGVPDWASFDYKKFLKD